MKVEIFSENFSKTTLTLFSVSPGKNPYSPKCHLSRKSLSFVYRGISHTRITLYRILLAVLPGESIQSDHRTCDGWDRSEYRI